MQHLQNEGVWEYMCPTYILFYVPFLSQLLFCSRCTTNRYQAFKATGTFNANYLF
jgi:hypothetical protein